MELLLKVINKPQEVNYTESFQFSKRGGTIGSNSNATWLLTDTIKSISGTHAEILYASGHFFLKDISTQGIYRAHNNSKVPSFELVRLNEGDSLRIGPYEISVNFIQEYSPNKAIEELLNQREIDVSMDDNVTLHKDHDSPMNVILKEKPLDKDILSYVDIIPEEEDPFGDVEKNNTVLTEHILVPTLKDNLEQEQPRYKTPSHQEYDLPLSIFFEKLGLDKNQLNSHQQALIVSEVIDAFFNSIRGIEEINHNIHTLLHQLNMTPTAIPKIDAYQLLQTSGKINAPSNLSKQLSRNYAYAIHHHTALYQAILDVDDELTKEMSPQQLNETYHMNYKRLPSFFNGFKLWNFYTTQYAHLNEANKNNSLIRKKLIKKYKKIANLFTLTQKGAE